MLILHGYFYNHAVHRPEWKDDVWAFDLEKDAFEPVLVAAPGGASPKASFYPSTVQYRGDVYMYGGDHDDPTTRGHDFGHQASPEVWKLVLDPPPSGLARALGGVLRRVASWFGSGIGGWSWVRGVGAIQAEWTQVGPVSRENDKQVPSPRTCHAAAVIGHTMYVSAGFNRSDLWAFDLLTYKWSLLFDNDPSLGSRFAHTIAVHQETLYAFGGLLWHGRGATNELWKMRPGSDTEWRQVSTPNEPWPSVRGHHAAVIAPSMDNMYVFGGLDCPTGPCTCKDDLWKYNFDTGAWTELRAAGAPTPRYSHSIVQIRGKLFVFGGESMKPYMYHNEVKRLDLGVFIETKGRDEL